MLGTLCNIMPALLVVAILLYFIFGRRKKKLEAIKSGKDVLVSWSYSPEDWKIYMDDVSSSWVKNKEIPGDVFITPESIYVTNGADEHLFHFGKGQILHCSFLNYFLDLRYKWTILSKGGITHEFFEEFRLFVPAARRAEVAELVEEFKAMAAGKQVYRRKIIKDNQVTSLSGDDNY